MPDADVLTAGSLSEWVARQRWFANPAHARLQVEGSVDLVEGGTVRTMLVRDTTPDSEALYQVPVVERPAEEDDPGLIAPGPTAVLDGPREPAFASRLVELLLGGGGASGDGVELRGEPVGWTGDAPAVRSAHVLRGEQSNTSIIVEAERSDGTPAHLIVKVFRALHDGPNPDVVLQSAIAAAGSRRVPATLGALTGSWPDPHAEGGTAHGHLAVAQEYLAGTRDAWRVALDAARAGEDFTAPARDLGAATAEVHRVLAGAMPVADPDEAARAALRDSTASRAARAERLVPSLAAVRDRISAALEAGAAAAWPRLQRVHGDYHLGQVLLAPERGWVLLDFEGEPLRPMAERNRPDLPLRDVAGMLRSFDYVAGTLESEGGDAAAARAWADAARAAFLAGYEAELGEPLGSWNDLLEALELDKALYECEYEVRNRPDWLPIPERAVHRLLGAGS